MIRNAWHFYYALVLVIKVVCGSLGIAWLTLNRALCTSVFRYQRCKLELLFNNYLSEFIAVLSITVLTIIIPGPDFFIVVRNSLAYTRRSGIFTTLGISFAV